VVLWYISGMTTLQTMRMSYKHHDRNWRITTYKVIILKVSAHFIKASINVFENIYLCIFWSLHKTIFIFIIQVSFAFLNVFNFISCYVMRKCRYVPFRKEVKVAAHVIFFLTHVLMRVPCFKLCKINIFQNLHIYFLR